jgi:hypothetical protein
MKLLFKISLVSSLTVTLLLNTVLAQANAQSNSKLLPFFDTVNNPEFHRIPPRQKVDITPPPPQLNNFDKAVLATCGTFNSKVEKNALQQLMSNNPEVLNRIQQAVGGEIYRNRQKKEQFLEDFVNIWFNYKNGFQHVFCGEIVSKTQIDGLHFVGRYLELQEKKIGGRLPKNQNNEEVKPGAIYTVGVLIVDKNGKEIARDMVKGYALPSNAEEIMTDATKAFKAQLPKATTQKKDCIYTVMDKETNQTFPVVFVWNNQGIRTFYSDATPSGNACRR